MPFNIDVPELIILIVLAIIIFGPDKLPDLARKTARVINYVRGIANGARDQLTEQLGPEFSDLRPQALAQNLLLGGEDLSEVKAVVTDAKTSLLDAKGTLTDAGASVSQAGQSVIDVGRTTGTAEVVASPSGVSTAPVGVVGVPVGVGALGVGAGDPVAGRPGTAPAREAEFVTPFDPEAT